MWMSRGRTIGLAIQQSARSTSLYGCGDSPSTIRRSSPLDMKWALSYGVASNSAATLRHIASKLQRFNAPIKTPRLATRIASRSAIAGSDMNSSAVTIVTTSYD